MHNKEKIKKFFLVLFSLIIILVAISLFTEYFFGHSFFAGICKMKCPVFLQANSIYEVVKVIGLTNILIGWIYAKLDNTMLGLTYSEILKSQFPMYALFAGLHFLSTLGCVAVSKAGLSESSILLLLAILIGFIYQGIVFYKIILSSKKCEYLAKLTWFEKKEEIDELKTNILNLAECMPEFGDKNYESHRICFVNLLIKCLNGNLQGEFDLILNIWDRLNKNTNLCNSRNIEQRDQDIFKSMFLNLEEEKESKKVICLFMSGYIAYIIADCDSKSQNLNMNVEFKTLIRAVNNIIYTLNSVSSENTALFDFFYDSTKTTLYLLVWVYFFDHRLKLTENLLEEIPRKEESQLFSYIIDVLFPEYIRDREKIQQAITTGKKVLEKKLNRG